MLRWLTKKYLPIGLDIGQNTLRAVQLVWHNGRLQLHCAAEAKRAGATGRLSQSVLSAEDAGVEACDEHVEQQVDEPLQDETLAEPLERLMDRGGFVRRDVMLHCPAERFSLRPVSLGPMTESVRHEDIMDALKLQIAQQLSLPSDEMIFDCLQTVHRVEQKQMTMLVIAAEREWITRQIELVQRAGLHCVGVDALCTALHRVACVSDNLSSHSNESGRIDCHEEIHDDLSEQASENRPEQGTMFGLIDMGYSGSTLIVCNDNGPVFCRRFGLGGQEFTDVLAERLSISSEQAELLKKTYGLDCRPRTLRMFSGTPQRQVSSDAGCAVSEVETIASELGKTAYAALQSELNDYVEGLTRSLNYVVSEHPNVRLRGVFLAGSGCSVAKLDDFLAAKLELPVERISHPLLTEIGKSLPASRSQVSGWTTALGLAMAQEVG